MSFLLNLDRQYRRPDPPKKTPNQAVRELRSSVGIGPNRVRFAFVAAAMFLIGVAATSFALKTVPSRGHIEEASIPSPTTTGSITPRR